MKRIVNGIKKISIVFLKAVKIMKNEGFYGISKRLDMLLAKGGVYDSYINEAKLNITLNRIYNLPEVIIDNGRAKTVNVLVPAFDFNSISAGFFGVFQAALFIKRLGVNVRLVMFDDFYFVYKDANAKLKNYPGLENLFDELEVECIGDRRMPLKVSPYDTSLATVWYSAYLAEKIQNVCNNNKAFIYLVQDHETRFYPGSSLSLLAEQSYKMNYAAMFSTSALQNYFIQHNVGDIAGRKLQHIFYDNACSRHLPSFIQFENTYKNSKKRKLVFYSRPVVNRNMYELGALVLIKAIEMKILDADEWEFYAIGLGTAELELADGKYISQMPRMNLKEYIESISGYDMCLTLMASPHPSLIPFDLAGSGCLVVTNNCDNKNQDYFDKYSTNIISCEPDLYALLEGIKQAAVRVPDLKSRYKSAENMKFPSSWDETWTNDHEEFVKKVVF